MAAFLVPSYSYAQQPAWTTTFNGEARYYSSRSSLGSSGSQVNLPIGAQLSGRPSPDWKFDFLVRGGYLISRQSTPTASSSVSTPTDTNVTPTLTYLGWNGITPYLSVAMNVPTARKASNPNTTQSNNKTDPDIVATPAFGEGFNIGPSLGTSFNITESVVLGIGGGATYRGAFDQASTVALSRFNPGDVYTVNSSLGYRGDQLSVQSSLAYSWETQTVQDGLPIYRAGPRLIAGLKVGYAWDDNWASKVNVNYSSFAKNEVPVAAGVPLLVREAFNSNSNVVKISVDTSYARDNYSIGPTLGYLYRNRNGYDPTTFQFVPAKTSWNAGVAGTYRFDRQFSVNAAVSYIWSKDSSNPNKVDAVNVIIPGSGTPESSTNAWVASLGGTYKF